MQKMDLVKVQTVTPLLIFLQKYANVGASGVEEINFKTRTASAGIAQLGER